ncbi:MAG: D-aminoacyl-tRNA deacylase [Mageeibacillus sp.]|jgi:D-tyrosyl-tRNA(Tyr) deacylase|nr:D-aminoacyl-tRNA deacylase [Mageeibacillus sp.]MCI1263392.1 D-aminoacyl-tRNA deacylase [Saccharofermentans sp.]MCI1769061.1 D-aminoacyl-tRNA deacylase [Mageeibacillus sp.]MCI2043989.1 D-aminoacyl-tRNA deacylase [Mageeibacillus sp.]
MRFVVTDVTDARVDIDNETYGKIDRGFCVLIGIRTGDDMATADRLVDKMLKMRVFADDNGKTNLSLDQVGGGLLLVSQFTLYADVRHGNRPSFTGACEPVKAEELYDYIVERCRKCNVNVATGRFGADMKVTTTNVGPFTIILDSDEL